MRVPDHGRESLRITVVIFCGSPGPKLKKVIRKRPKTFRDTAVRSRFILVSEKIKYVTLLCYSERTGGNGHFYGSFLRWRSYL